MVYKIKCAGIYIIEIGEYYYIVNQLMYSQDGNLTILY